MNEFEKFILAVDVEIRNGLRAEQALRRVVTEMAAQIRREHAASSSTDLTYGRGGGE
jgi:hypothetical protein